MANQTSAMERTENRIKEPRQYRVVMLNDDFTSMEFVVAVLVEIFHKDELTAEAIMLSVHKTGKGIVGNYPYDIAVTKVDAALKRAREEDFPFRMIIEEV